MAQWAGGPLRVLGIIPARGGSKGIPGKNLRPLAGRPLVAWTIEAARGARRLERVVVSTDDRRIAEVARRWGAEVPFMRPARFSTDTASTLSVVRHALRRLQRNEGYEPDAVAVLSPTTPLRGPDAIDACIALFETSSAPMAATITPVRDHPYYVYALGRGGKLREAMRVRRKPTRRQDLPPFYAHNQAVMVIRRDAAVRTPDDKAADLLASGVGLPIEWWRAWDIDTPMDLAVAEALLRL